MLCCSPFFQVNSSPLCATLQLSLLCTDCTRDVCTYGKAGAQACNVIADPECHWAHCRFQMIYCHCVLTVQDVVQIEKGLLIIKLIDVICCRLTSRLCAAPAACIKL